MSSNLSSSSTGRLSKKKDTTPTTTRPAIVPPSVPETTPPPRTTRYIPADAVQLPSTPITFTVAQPNEEEGTPWMSNNGLHVKKRTPTNITLAWSLDEPDASLHDYPVSRTQIPVSDEDVAEAAGTTPPGGLIGLSAAAAHAAFLAAAEPEDTTKEHKAKESEQKIPVISLVSSESELESDPQSSSAESKPELSSSDSDGESESKPSYLTTGPWYEIQMKKHKSDDSEWQSIYRGYSTKCEIRNLRPDTTMTFRMRANGDPSWGTSIVAATEVPQPTAEELLRAVDCNANEMVMRIIGFSKPSHLKTLLTSVDRHGQNALMLCANNNNPKLLTSLLKAGAPVNAQNAGGKTALMIACSNGDLDSAQLLDKHNADFLIKDKGGLNAMHYAVSSGCVPLVEYVLKRSLVSLDVKDDNGWTPLMRAVAIGTSFPIIRLLLRHGANPNAADKNNTKSCLMIAATKNTQDIMNSLLEYNANPLYLNCNGTTAFDMANNFGVSNNLPVLEKAMQDWKDLLIVDDTPDSDAESSSGQPARCPMAPLSSDDKSSPKPGPSRRPSKKK